MAQRIRQRCGLTSLRCKCPGWSSPTLCRRCDTKLVPRKNRSSFKARRCGRFFEIVGAMKSDAKRDSWSPQSRPPLERMLRIHQAIQAGKFPNASVLARELEVSTKSIHRDIEFMRDRLELPIEYDGRRFGYHYTEEVSAFPTVQITEGELFALIVAEKALEQYRGTNFEKPLLSAIKKMEQSLPDTISLNLAEVEQAISFRTRAEPILDLEIFDALARATARRSQIRLEYRKPGRQEAE